MGLLGNLSKAALLAGIVGFCGACQQGGKDRADGQEPLTLVNPYIGTGGHGHTFLGVAAPFGAVQVGPNNINKGWDWCSGYHYSDSVLIGFAHLHLNGTGCSDTGDLLFMPYTGKEQTDKGTQENPEAGYASRYSHEQEIARPGYYAVSLSDYGVKVELTASDRVAFHRYTYPEGADRRVMVNLKEANGDDRPVETFLKQVDEHTIQGYRYSKGWSKDQRIFFTAVFSEPVVLSLIDDQTPVEGTELKGLNVKGNLTMNGPENQLLVKVGISPVSMENAWENIKTEIPDWDFEHVVAQTDQKWNRELAKVRIESPDTAALNIFYTGMYHAFLQPNLFNDCNKDYRGTDKKEYTGADFDNYTVFSLWDTYRAAHPLYTILQPERVPDFIRSMLAIYEQQGLLPVWHLYGSDTKEMIGIQSVPVIADAILKGVPGFDYEKAFEAMKSSMLSNYKGLEYLKEGNYIPADREKESVAKGLEYAIADWGVAQVAKKLGKEEDYRWFKARSENYREYWDKKTHFFRGKNVDGTWSQPFSPFRSAHRNDDYCEGNGWQYTWLVPHDVEGLVNLFGSEKAFSLKLDSLFIVEGDMGAEASGDISGLIGQYAHGNEPGHHTVYLYAFVGEQWKTAEKVRNILKTMYRNEPNGLEGNEDCGQMSSWYLFSAMGFYPANPSNGIYVFGSPLFDKITLALAEGKSFVIEAVNNSERNIYIQSVELNGEPYTKSYIRHADICRGGTLKFIMGGQPNRQFGAAVADRPHSGL